MTDGFLYENGYINIKFAANYKLYMLTNTLTAANSQQPTTRPELPTMYSVYTTQKSDIVLEFTMLLWNMKSSSSKNRVSAKNRYV